ncbi:MAG: hypothetical protein ACYTF1_23650 [Planctomycetota bacterium]|jgi:hypothetical protein
MFDYLFKMLFEEMPLLLVAEFIALAVALGIHRRRYTDNSRLGVWITLGVCAALIALQMTVVTDREKIENLINVLAQAADEGDVQTIGEELDEKFLTDGKNKKQFIGDVNSWLQRWQIDEAKIRRLKIVLEDRSATATFSAWCNARKDSNVHYNNHSKWQLKFIKGHNGWKVTNIRLLKVGPFNFSSVYDIYNY